jgi:aconitate hydratase
MPLMVTPGSGRSARPSNATADAVAQDIGAVVLANACGPCIGQWRRSHSTAGTPNTIVTSYNRNFPRRNDGQATTMNFIASPEIVTALALAGELSFNPLTDSLTGGDGRPFRLAPPAPAPEVPAKHFERGRSTYIAPPEDGRRIALQSIRGASAPLLGALAGLGRTGFLDLPSRQDRGKTTTTTSACRPWLRYRGHLDKFSDNLLQGAVNGFTKEAGRGTNVLTGETGQPLSKLARDYRSRGLRWVIIGDANYGEGSSREHAALSPRLLGGAAVIARGFARIHESNLKKQGLLALCFLDLGDYERIREDDRVSLLGLATMAPGKPLGCRVRHADGTGETLRLDHSYSAAQLEWFRAGSALNAMASSEVSE